MTAPATNRQDFSTLVKDALAGHTLDPISFAFLTVNDLVELDGYARVPEGTSANQPENAKLQEYMRRSLRVIEELMWLGFDIDRALFWFRNFRIGPLNKSPLMLMADDCLDIVLTELDRTFKVHKESLGKIWEKVRVDTIQLQEELIERVAMYTAFEVARTCAPARVLDSEFLVARDLVQAGTMFHVMWHRKPLFPKYQFDVAGRPKPIVARVLRVLSPHLTSWDMAFWCSAQNAWLGGRSPVELLEEAPDSIIKAAEQEVVER